WPIHPTPAGNELHDAAPRVLAVSRCPARGGRRQPAHPREHGRQRSRRSRKPGNPLARVARTARSRGSRNPWRRQPTARAATPEHLAREIATLIDDAALRRDLVAAAGTLVDGKGGERIVSAMREAAPQEITHAA